MQYLLDTNVCIDHINGKFFSIRRKLDEQPPQNVFICSIVKAELLADVYRSPDPIKSKAIVDSFLSVFRSLPFDDLVADMAAQIHADLSVRGMMIGAADIFIAAIALTHDLTMVTANTREFGRITRLRVEDWRSENPPERSVAGNPST